jgi:hypothetical protein
MRAAERAEAAAAAAGPAEAASGTPARGEREQRRAVARAAAVEVAALEAGYQQAFAAIETLVGAIERVRELRGHQHGWEEAKELGFAPRRPEPWHVRVSHDAQLRPLYKRFTDAVNSPW